MGLNQDFTPAALPAAAYYCLDVGGTHATAGAVNGSDFSVGEMRRVPVDSTAGAATIIEGIVTAAEWLNAGPNASWSIAVPGPFDYHAGVAHYEGVGKFDSLRGMNLRTALAARLGTLPDRIHFVKDSDAYALGEYIRGSALNLARFACITLGTGIGSAFVSHGSPVHSGPDVPADGDVYQLLHDGGPLEDTVSRRAIRTRYASSGAEPADVKEITQRAREGDPVALQAIRIPFRALATCLAPWLQRFDAQSLVIGGSIAQADDVVFPIIEAQFAVENVTLPLGLRRARFGDEGALIGAAVSAAQLRESSTN